MVEVEPTQGQGGMDFGIALAALKAGESLFREGWNGKGQYVAMHKPTSSATDQGNSLPYLFMITVDGERVPWVASQSDLLADDWYAVKPDETEE